MDSPLNLFLDETSYVLANPHWSEELQKHVQQGVLAQTPPNHIWVASSGTENFKAGHIKMVGLSKSALLNAAKSVCATFQITEQDVYYNVLPLYHVGGLSTLARSHVSGCHYISAQEKKWNPQASCEEWTRLRVSITSLVPTQIFDLVAHALKAPATLRLVFVGGGALSQELWKKAKVLGWNLVPTYGMTEACAMIAYTLDGDGYSLFPHIEECRAVDGDRLQIRSPSLFSGYIFISPTTVSSLEDPKRDGWFASGDRAQVQGRKIYLLGRESELVKIKGESVSLLELTISLENFCLQNNLVQRFVVLPVENARDGHSLCLLTEDLFPQLELEKFNKTQLPFARILHTQTVPRIPLTPLGKVDVSAARALLR